MIRSNLNRCRFEILEIINRLERAHLSQSRIASSVGVGGGRGSWDVVGASQRGRIRTIIVIDSDNPPLSENLISNTTVGEFQNDKRYVTS
jgi:tRNA A37 threonylcarbamoyladenosine dehydratase